MNDFTEELAKHIRDNISNLIVYNYTHPAIKDTVNQICCVLPSGEIGSSYNRLQWIETKQFVVSGSANSSLSKAREICDFLFPINSFVKFKTANFIVQNVFVNEKPSLFKNENNIFFATFRLRFLVAGG